MPVGVLPHAMFIPGSVMRCQKGHVMRRAQQGMQVMHGVEQGDKVVSTDVVLHGAKNPVWDQCGATKCT